MGNVWKKMAARTLPLKLIQVVCDHFTVVNRTIHLFLFWFFCFSFSPSINLCSHLHKQMNMYIDINCIVPGSTKGLLTLV